LVVISGWEETWPQWPHGAVPTWASMKGQGPDGQRAQGGRAGDGHCRTEVPWKIRWRMTRSVRSRGPDWGPEWCNGPTMSLNVSGRGLVPNESQGEDVSEMSRGMKVAGHVRWGRTWRWSHVTTLSTARVKPTWVVKAYVVLEGVVKSTWDRHVG